jgi:hypothetical protein
MFLLCAFGFLGADLLLHRRVHLGFLGDRVPDKFDGDLLHQIFAAAAVGIARCTCQRFELHEHRFNFPMIMHQNFDHIALSIRHYSPH